MTKFVLVFWGTLGGLLLICACSGCVSARPLTGTSISWQYSVDTKGLEPLPCDVQQHMSMSVTRQF